MPTPSAYGWHGRICNRCLPRCLRSPRRSAQHSSAFSTTNRTSRWPTSRARPGKRSAPRCAEHATSSPSQRPRRIAILRDTSVQPPHWDVECSRGSTRVPRESGALAMRERDIRAAAKGRSRGRHRATVALRTDQVRIDALSDELRQAALVAGQPLAIATTSRARGQVTQDMPNPLPRPRGSH